MIPSFINKSNLPHRPGVYIYKNKEGKILYVGKAIDLYHRVASYFRGYEKSSSAYFNRQNDPKTSDLVKNIAGIETIEVYSEIEALILEANLIKKYRPPYNIKLMDDKDYLYIKITKEEFPRIITARKHELEGSREYFGPFPSSRNVRLTLKKLRRIFPWCDRPYPKDKRPCFNYHLGLCPGACAGKITPKEYNKNIKHFSQFMQGKKEELLENLIMEMSEASANQEYEKAQHLKRVIEGVEYLTQPNQAAVYLENPNFVADQTKIGLNKLKEYLNLKVIPERIECYDISNMQGQQAVGSLVVLIDGEIDKKWYRKFKIRQEGKPNDVLMMEEVISRRLNHPEWPKPDLILVDGGKGQTRAAQKALAGNQWDIPIFGLAKRFEWIYQPDGETIKLPKSSPALMLLQKIRDEAHRFAITYHRNITRQQVTR